MVLQKLCILRETIRSSPAQLCRFTDMPPLEWKKFIHRFKKARSILSSFPKKNWWKRQNQKCKLQNLVMGTTFCIDVIDKSCNITLNVEHGRSSGCWRYLVCLKPSLPLAYRKHKNSFTSQFTVKNLWEKSTLSRTNIVIDLCEATGRFLIFQTQPMFSTWPFWPSETAQNASGTSNRHHLIRE